MLPQHSSKSVEWYTPALYMKAVRRVFQSSITLDPASCAKANLVIQAENFYDQHDDGLRRAWHGKVFCNPPYGRTIDGISNQYLWSVKAVVEFEAGNVEEMILLCNAATSERWYKRLVQRCSYFCQTDHRIEFYAPDGAHSQPTHGNAFFYFGEKGALFAQVFRQFGMVIPASAVIMDVPEELPL